MVDIIAPVTDYLNKAFFTDNEVMDYGRGNVNVGLAWLEMLDLDLGTITNGERILLTAKCQGAKTGDGQTYTRFAKKSGTGDLRFVGVFSGNAGLNTYCNDGGSVYHAYAAIGEVYLTGTYVIKLEGLCTAGTCLMATPHHVITAHWLRKL